jgi:hypothetical protein
VTTVQCGSAHRSGRVDNASRSVDATWHFDPDRGPFAFIDPVGVVDISAERDR